MNDVIYLQKQARICREVAAEVDPAEATGLIELAAAYENQVHWVVKGRSSSEFMLRKQTEPQVVAANDPGGLGPDF